MLRKSPAIGWIAVGVALLLGSCGALDSFQYERKAKDAVARLLLDPSSAEFRNMATRRGHVCGEVNGKNRAGAYVGFRRFVVDTSNWNALIDPNFSYSDLLSAEDLCVSMRSNSYSSLATMESTCSRAEEMGAEQLQQQEFDRTWGANCAASAQAPFHPSLSAVPMDSSQSNDAVAELPSNSTVDALPNSDAASVEPDGESVADEQTDNSTSADTNEMPDN